MRKHILLTCILVCLGICAQAQEQKAEQTKGKAIIQVFGKFNTGIDPQNNNRGFELERSYLGYEYKLENGLSIKSVLDVGKSLYNLLEWLK